MPMPTRLLLLVAALAAGSVHAQGQNNYGSTYSLYGVGERGEMISSQGSMLGLSGVATRSIYTSVSNPALWSDLTVTTFAAGASVTTVRAEDGLSAETSTGSAGDLTTLHLGLPILPGRLGLVVAYGPYSRTNYRSASVDSLLVEDEQVPYELNLEGAGGLQVVRAGLGGRIGQSLQLGVSGDIVFGTQEILQRTAFGAADYREVRESEATRVRGITGTLGAAFTARSLGSEDDALTVGAALTLPTALDLTRTRTLGESLDRDTLASEVDGSATLPLVVRGGLAYTTGGRWLATVEGLYEPWSGFESTLPMGGFDDARDVDLLQDRVRVGGGLELTPGGRDRRAALLSRTAYRIGGYAERGLYAPTGSDVTTLALTAGLSVPNRFTGARFDLGLEVGTRGSADDVLVHDTFLKGTFTLNFGERWFVRRRFN